MLEKVFSWLISGKVLVSLYLEGVNVFAITVCRILQVRAMVCRVPQRVCHTMWGFWFSHIYRVLEFMNSQGKDDDLICRVLLTVGCILWTG